MAYQVDSVAKAPVPGLPAPLAAEEEEAILSTRGINAGFYVALCFIYSWYPPGVALWLNRVFGF